MNKFNVPKIVKILLITLMLISITTNVFSATLTLNQIADKLKTSNPMAEHLKENYDSTVNANVTDNKITLEQTNSPFSDGKTIQTEFILEDNILSSKIEKNSQESTTTYMLKLSLAWMLIDCIGQLNGYEKEAFYKTLKGTGDKYKDYKLDKEGLEINILSSSTEIKIDLSKKIPLLEIEDSSENNSNSSQLELIHIDTSTNTYNVKYSNSTNSNNISSSINNNSQNITNNSNLPKTGDTTIFPIIAIFFIIASICYIKYKNINF